MTSSSPILILPEDVVQIENMKRIFFIGDTHGCSLTFKKMITKKIDLQKTDELYCVGDYIDRGPDSKGVVDFILNLRAEGYNVHTVRGNHEQMMLDSMTSINSCMLWMLNGGEKTLESFGIETARDLPKIYRDFFHKTDLFFQTGSFIVVHAGLNFNISHPLKDKESMLWIRSFSPDERFLQGRLLIHGHTPRSKNDIMSQKINSVVNIDGGCVFKYRQDMGNLVALNFYEKKLLFQPNIDPY